MVCDKCNSNMKAIYGPQQKDSKGKIFRSVFFRCSSCKYCKQEIEYITHEEVNGIIETSYKYKG